METGKRTVAVARFLAMAAFFILILQCTYNNFDVRLGKNIFNYFSYLASLELIESAADLRHGQLGNAFLQADVPHGYNG